MTTLTLQIDSRVAQRAEAIARERDTTISTLVEELLDRLVRTESQLRGQQAQQLMATLRELSRPMGGKTWVDRDQLHER